MKQIFGNNLGSQHSLVMKFGQYITKEKVLLKKSMKNVTYKIVPSLFNF